nr:alpha/beta hydrolase [Halochromatium glycolicum]
MVTTGSGRRIAFSRFGAEDGYPALYAHGFPSSRQEARLMHEAARELGVRLISIDRPGYGDSDPAPDRCIIDWPDDVAALADALELKRFALIGVSGGGPYMLACAWRLSQCEAHPLHGRVSACLLVCPLGAIYRTEQLNQMHWAIRLNLGVGKQPQWLADLLFGAPTTALFARWPALVENSRSLAAPLADRQVLSDPKVRAILNRTIADAMRNGASGARRDLRLYTHDWGMRLEEIEFPVRIWHGQADGTVPIEHARWYAKQIPAASLTERPGEGHYSIQVCYCRQMLAELVESSRA